MKEAPRGFDWPALMRLAFTDLGLSPDRFWGLTPFEFLMLIRPESGLVPLRRAAFEALLAQFPDTSAAKDEDADDRNI